MKLVHTLIMIVNVSIFLGN